MRALSTPENFDDTPYPLAATVESCRRRMLDWLAAHDYRLIIPPLVEYLDTLTAGDDDLDLQTFKLTDTLSGRTLGIRADHTFQIARHAAGAATDATEDAAQRYCYCGATVSTRPPQPWLPREKMQLGAELLRQPAPFADWEIIHLALGALAAAGVNDLAVDLGNCALFHALVGDAMPSARARELSEHIQRRDVPAIEQVARAHHLPPGLTEAMVLLAHAADATDAADAPDALLSLAKHPAFDAKALEEIQYVAQGLTAANYDVQFSLNDMGSYGYHDGIVFTIYSGAQIVATGGRYRTRDGVGGVGFSADLLAVGALLPPPQTDAPISAPIMENDAAWQEKITQLLDAGRRIRYVNTDAPLAPPCLIKSAGGWEVQER